MIRNTIKIWEPGEYEYELSFGFEPTVDGYLHDEASDNLRPCLLVVPGGAYRFVSPSEAEPVARVFYELGYNVFVLTYTTDVTMTVPLLLRPLQDISRAMRLLRRRSNEFSIDAGKIAICGFSAGGHSPASLAVHHADVTDDNPAYAGISNRPDAAILSYPVITTGPYTHVDSASALTGAPVDRQTNKLDLEQSTDEQRRWLEYMSLEKQVTNKTPPCFVWHTAPDVDVPVENAYSFASACHAQGINCALHIFSKGPHGMSVANDVWANIEYTDTYSVAQHVAMAEAVRDGRLSVMPEIQGFLDMTMMSRQDRKELQVFTNQADQEIAVWPKVADCWLKDVFAGE